MKSIKQNNSLYKKLIQLQVHVGHLYFLWNPIMNFYLLGKTNNYHILDIRLTLFLLKKSLNFVQQIYKCNGFILIVSNGKDSLLSLFLNKCSRTLSLSNYINNWSPGLLQIGVMSLEKVFALLNC